MTSNSEFINQVVALVNQRRALANLPPVAVDSQLSRAAQIHAEDMAENDFFSLTGSDGSTTVSRLAAVGYRFSNFQENISAALPNPEQVVENWFNDPGQ
ncbi:MAG: CAP domain-containing protein, partial [Chroococcales cyanobacterium]